MAGLLTVAEAAKFIGITNKAIYLAIENGRIIPVRVLGKFGIPLDEAKKYKKAREYANGNGKRKAA